MRSGTTRCLSVTPVVAVEAVYLLMWLKASSPVETVDDRALLHCPVKSASSESLGRLLLLPSFLRFIVPSTMWGG